MVQTLARGRVTAYRPGMSTSANRPRTKYVDCPCGELLEGADEDALVEAVQAHLTQVHPGRSYERDQILMLAY